MFKSTSIAGAFGLVLITILGVHAVPPSEQPPEFYLPADPAHVLLSYGYVGGLGGFNEALVRLFSDGTLEVLDRGQGRILVDTLTFVELRDLLESLWRHGVLTSDYAVVQQRAEAVLRTLGPPTIESDLWTTVLRIDVPGYRAQGAETGTRLVREIRWRGVFRQAAELKGKVPELQALAEALREIDALRERHTLTPRQQP